MVQIAQALQPGTTAAYVIRISISLLNLWPYWKGRREQKREAKRKEVQDWLDRVIRGH